MPGEAEYKEPTNGAKRAIGLALIATVVAGLGWADAYERGKTLTAYKGELASAGLDPTNVGTLRTTLAAEKRALADVQNALVAGTAAANFRQQQVSSLIDRASGLDAEVGDLAAQISTFGIDAKTVASVAAGIASKRRELVDVENALVATTAAQSFRATQLGMLSEKTETVAGRLAEATAKADSLEAQNRQLGPKIATFQNEIVAAEAAAEARQGELLGLIADVEKNKDLVAQATAWAANHAALTQTNEALARRQVDLENRITSLIAAVSFRQDEISKILVTMNDAVSEEQNARLSTLALHAEARSLGADIAALMAERKTVEAGLVDVNNRFVPALAAVKTREAQLDKLVADVTAAQKTFETLSAENSTMQARLAETDERIYALAGAARTAAQHLAEIDKLFEKPTVQAALSRQ